MQESSNNNSDLHSESADPTSPEREPRITGISNPFGVIQKSIDKYLKEKNYWESLEEILQSCKAIVDVQAEDWKNLPDSSIVEDNICRQRFENKTPALRKEDFLIFEKDFTPLILRIFNSLYEDNINLIDIKESISDNAIKKFTENTADLYEEIKKSCNLEDETILLGLNSAYQVFAASAAINVRTQFDQDVWEQGFCPICGTGPEMGKISDRNNHYYLSCALCFTEWKYPRIGCPFCGNTDNNELAHFTSDEYKGYRVNVCKKCNSYVKVTLESDLNRKHIPVVDPIITLELDSVAIDEGFHHGEISYDEIKGEFGDPVEDIK